VTVVVRVRDDEERVGHVVRKVAAHLRGLRLRFEVLVADEGSGDNTVAVAALVHRDVPELEVMHSAAGQGFYDACLRARGRSLVLYDARLEAPLAPLGFALGRLRDGADVVAVAGRYLVCRRTRAWRAFDALVTRRRRQRSVEQRFLRRARALGLQVAITTPPRRTLLPWARLRASFMRPRASLT
jgi:glycosyltransferase involved in cell wall biosynthesis